MTEPSADPATSNVVSLPGEGRGMLTTPEGEHLPVRTFKRGRDVVLVVLTSADEQTRDARLDRADLEYASQRGIVRLHGEAVFEERSLIRFEAQGDPEVMQRRSFVRVHAPQAVTLDCGEGEERAHTVDVSGGGMLLTGASNLEAAQAVSFQMSLGDGEPPIAGLARVVRVGNDGVRALSFEQIDEEDRQRLIRYVFECMRTDRARTRRNRV